MKGRISAGATLPLSGPSGRFGRDAATALSAWSRSRGVRLILVDCGDSPERAAAETARLAGRVDLLFGPYGSGLTRAAAEACASTGAVLWNHGGAAVPVRRGRVVDVLGPAERYWEGLPAFMAAQMVPPAAIAVLVGRSPFGRAVAVGATAALGPASRSYAFDVPTAAQVADRALAHRARVIVACARPEEDLALGRALAGRGVPLGLVLCGTRMAEEAFGDALAGWFGPAQWAGDGSDLPLPLPRRTEYPGAQALACALLAERALALAGSSSSDALWDAARVLRTRTFLGPFAVDEDGRQIAHTPLLVQWTGRPPRREVVWRPCGSDPGTLPG